LIPDDILLFEESFYYGALPYIHEFFNTKVNSTPEIVQRFEEYFSSKPNQTMFCGVSHQLKFKIFPKISCFSRILKKIIFLKIMFCFILQQEAQFLMDSIVLKRQQQQQLKMAPSKFQLAFFLVLFIQSWFFQIINLIFDFLFLGCI
jgi:hypothetical protein